MSVQVLGLTEAQRAVNALNKGMKPKLQKVTKTGAMQFKPAAQSEARPLSRRLAKSVSVKAGKRDKPSAVLTFRPKIAWFRHFVIQGTRDHGPKKAKVLVWNGGDAIARHVRGVPPHPVLERVFAEKQQAASNAMADQLLKE